MSRKTHRGAALAVVACLLAGAAPSDEPGCGLPDDYVAPWPQQAVETRVYDEALPPGPLRDKADAFQWWQTSFSVPYHGAIIEATRFDGPLSDGGPLPSVIGHSDFNDSCEWTGLHLGAQAMRYHVTASPDARAQAMRTVDALSRNLHVTATPGFIARYSAPQDPLIYAGDAWCDSEERCHRVESGPFAGEWWWGETSRDMYGGWFFGMALAHDLVDDEPTRERIRADVHEVLATLIEHDWLILDEEGLPTDSAPNISPPFRVSWLLIGYHLTGDPAFAEALKPWLLDSARLTFTLNTLSGPNRYSSYFGNALSHELWYNLLRLAKVYLSPGDAKFFLQVFETQIHTFTRLSHNPFFNAVFMGQGAYEPAPGDPYQSQLEEDLTLFPPAPRTPYLMPARPPDTYELDPLSVTISDLVEAFPVIFGLLFPEARPQALAAFPMNLQCERKLFERSPFIIDACGEDDPTRLGSGTDFLLSYWMSAYHGYLTKDR